MHSSAAGDNGGPDHKYNNLQLAPNRYQTQLVEEASAMTEGNRSKGVHDIRASSNLLGSMNKILGK